jgi:hypothetical protein
MKIYTNIDVFFNKYEFSAKKIKKASLETAPFLITSKPI